MGGAKPSGPAGRALALALTLSALLVAWAGVVAPAFDWFANRQDTLRRQTALAQRMAALVDRLPALREQAAGAGQAAGPAPDALLAGATDSLAAASLQQQLDALATAAGVRIGSEEIMPPRAAGDFRAISVRVTLTAPWKSVIGLLLAMGKAEVPMVADDIQLRGPVAAGTAGDPDPPIDATFTVAAYRLPPAP
jgi:hypothetical protein